jgi:adenylyltransferase/sulfurtransferase
MRDQDSVIASRYSRQVLLPALGLAGQRSLAEGRALIVGVGGLGSWVAELLARAGVGFLRLVDPDKVDLTNIHRQALYTEADAERHRPKVEAAAARIKEINAGVTVEPVMASVDRTNIAGLAAGVGVLIDGTDNFAARYLINDYAVKFAVPWVFAGVIRSEAQVMTILPGRTACLRCILESPPPPCEDPNCRTAGVLGPAVAAVASLQAIEAVKVLAGRAESVLPYLLKVDYWGNSAQQVSTTGLAKRPDCPCCGQKDFEFLEP